MDVLNAGGLEAEVTFGEMTTRSLTGCNTVDGIMGMGPSNSGDDQSIFEDLVDVSEPAGKRRLHAASASEQRVRAVVL